jgi:putative transposase
VRQLCKATGISTQAYYKARGGPSGVSSTSPTTPRTPPPNMTVSDAELREAILAVKAEEHAEFWGHRKVWAILRHQKHLAVGHNRVWKMMGAMDLLLPATGPHSLHARESKVAVPESNRRWGTDLTTVWTRQDGVVAVGPVIDFCDRELLAIGVSKSQESEIVLEPLERALREAFGTSEGVPDGMELRIDNGPQYRGSVCHTLCEDWRVEQSFSIVGRPTCNAITERVILTMKTELIWARDWESAAELREALEAWRITYNNLRPHESLGWMTPAQQRAENLGAATVAAA